MGLFVLISSLISTISDTIKESADNRRANEERLRYENIDWDNIEYVTLDGTKTAYRIEEDEEFDIVMTDFLTQQDGWQHYETKTVKHEVEDGENYCFTIRYKNGTKIYREFHEDSSLTERLLTYVNEEDCDPKSILEKDPILARFNEIINDSLALLETTTTPETYFSRYKTVIDNANRILKYTNNSHCREYALDIISDFTENRTENYKDFIDRCDIEDKLYSYKDQFLSYKYDISPEVKEYVISLLKEIEAEKEADEPKERFIVIDFETTGLNYNFQKADHDEIISVAIIDQDENVLLDTYCNTMKKQTWHDAERINGISPSDVKGYPTFVEILPQVVEILLSYDYVIAYNTKFERVFLFNYAMHYAGGDQSVFRIRWGLDPMEMFMKYMNSERFLKLENAAEHFGYTYSAHNALEDTKATLHVYKALRN